MEAEVHTNRGLASSCFEQLGPTTLALSSVCTTIGGAGMARSGESTRLRFDSPPRSHMWVEFVVGSRPCSKRFFSRYSGFPLSSKTNTSKFQFDVESVPNYCSALNSFTLKKVIYLFNLLFFCSFNLC